MIRPSRSDETGELMPLKHYLFSCIHPFADDYRFRSIGGKDSALRAASLDY